MSKRRKMIASANVNGTTATYINVVGFGTITKVGPGRYDLPGDTALFMPGGPAPSFDRVVFFTSVTALDSLPKVLTLLPVTPGVVSVLITQLDGTPVDAIFSVGVERTWPI